MDKPNYITINQFAREHNVPPQAVINAINLNKLRTSETIDGELVIPADQINSYHFELIGIYEYAARKNVTFGAVYKRLDKGKMLFTVEDVTDLMKIDWELYKDEKFRSFTFKFRGKSKVLTQTAQP